LSTRKRKSRSNNVEAAFRIAGAGFEPATFGL
jgi:hypothetical protein